MSIGPSEARNTDSNETEGVNHSHSDTGVVPADNLPLGSASDEELREEEAAAQLGDFA